MFRIAVTSLTNSRIELLKGEGRKTVVRWFVCFLGGAVLFVLLVCLLPGFSFYK